jgi:ribA/ribD-fused uncharacterized protein
MVKAHTQTLTEHQQQLQIIAQKGSAQVKPLAKALLEYLSQIPDSAIIPAHAYIMISYLGISRSAEETNVIRGQLLTFKYTPSEIDQWNKEKQVMGRESTRIFFTNKQELPFYLFSFQSNSPFMDSRVPKKTWTNVFDYYLYRMAIYLGDTTMAESIKDGSRLEEARQLKIKGWPQNPSPDFRSYQRRVMYRGNLLKFVNPYNDPQHMRSILLCSTINRTLLFAENDLYWGIGETVSDFMKPSNQFTGKNILGNILMAIRNQLFTSTRDEIVQFLENDAKAPSNSSYLQSAFWKDIM